MHHSNYRRDIDGLRAIAVLLVVAFHAVPNGLKAGFIGVDIFFVISGFLITGILTNAIRHGNINIIDFYQRRIKRIFPALLLVLTLSLVFGAFVLYPEEFKQLGYHIVGGSLFLSNIFLWKESGYFDNASELKPLLHLWSLAIEEQFYIFFPLLLWACKWPRLRSTVLGVLFLASFAFGIWLTSENANSAYLLPFSRFWELLAGGLLALHGPKLGGHPSMRKLADGTSILGAAFIALALAYINKVSFPGASAMLPVLGAVLLIGAGPAALINRSLLSSRLMVGIGLISYPLYLWHWVLFSFARIIYDNKPPQLLIIVLVGVAFVAAALTYKALEAQVRVTKSKAIAWYLLLCMAVVGACGYMVMTNSVEWQKKWGPSMVRVGPIDHASFNDTLVHLKNLCARYQQLPDTCPNLKDFPEGKVAVFGDSHAEQFSVGLAALKPSMNVTFYNALGLPFLGSKPTDFSIQEINAKPEISAVIMIALWEKRMNVADPAVVDQLRKTIRMLQQHGKKVYLVDTVPYFPFLPQQCKYAAPWLRESRCSVSVDVSLGPRKTHIDVLRAIAVELAVPFFNLSDYLCDRESCRMNKADYVLYRDENHVNLEGAKHVVRGFLSDSGL